MGRAAGMSRRLLNLGGGRVGEHYADPIRGATTVAEISQRGWPAAGPVSQHLLQGSLISIVHCSDDIVRYSDTVSKPRAVSTISCVVDVEAMSEMLLDGSLAKLRDAVGGRPGAARFNRRARASTGGQRRAAS